MALTLGAKIAQFVATDQDYAMKLLRQNITQNLDVVFPASKGNKRSTRTAKYSIKPTTALQNDRIKAEVLDWEEDSVEHLGSFDLIIACDCIYNEALIEPLNTTCASICKLRGEDGSPTLCVVAQQLRSHDVFEAWLKSFHRLFRTWQIPDRYLTKELRENSGFVVHVGIVR